MLKRLTPETSKKLIESLGGTKRVSEIFSCSMSSVSQWKKNGIPRGYVFYLSEKFRENEHILGNDVQAFLRPNS
jgi:hypothetical protein|uniref:DNA-binding transcriptional regulator n=1 Tax=Myoviridae sp. ctakU3 TaxID=2825135 RepID=A0A8S5P0N9_9CAUD|nr:MAG TPA: DNA-binding transcriptional regulator [Myoviridae sp. ctakU3]